METLQWTFLGNTIENYLWFLGIFLVGLIFKNLISKLISFILFNVLRRYFKSIGVQKFVDLTTKPFSLTIFVLVIFFACQFLHFPDEWHLASGKEFGVRMMLDRLFLVVLIFCITWTLLRIMDYVGLVMKERARITESKMDDLFVPFIISAIKAVMIIFSLFFVLGAVFKLNVASIIAGLGIGGLAIALASKETLENLLGSFLIFADKPFAVGDLIKTDQLHGHIEEVGFRSTKIRTLEKTLISVPNKKMIDAELENQTIRTFYRYKFNIGLVYTTSASQLRKIMEEIRAVLDENPMIEENPNVFFSAFGESALIVTIIYLVRTSDYDTYENIKQDINFRIMDIVNSNGSGFAYPSTSVYIEKKPQ